PHAATPARRLPLLVHPAPCQDHARGKQPHPHSMPHRSFPRRRCGRSVSTHEWKRPGMALPADARITYPDAALLPCGGGWLGSHTRSGLAKPATSRPVLATPQALQLEPKARIYVDERPCRQRTPLAPATALPAALAGQDLLPAVLQSPHGLAADACVSQFARLRATHWWQVDNARGRCRAPLHPCLCLEYECSTPSQNPTMPGCGWPRYSSQLKGVVSRAIEL